MSSGKGFLHGLGLAVMAGGAVGGFAAPLALVAYGLEPGVFVAVFAPSVAAILAGAGLATWAAPRPAPMPARARVAYGYVRSSAGEGLALSMTASDVTTVAALSSVSVSLSDGGSCGSDACGC